MVLTTEQRTRLKKLRTIEIDFPTRDIQRIYKQLLEWKDIGYYSSDQSSIMPEVAMRSVPTIVFCMPKDEKGWMAVSNCIPIREGEFVFATSEAFRDSSGAAEPGSVFIREIDDIDHTFVMNCIDENICVKFYMDEDGSYASSIVCINGYEGTRSDVKCMLDGKAKETGSNVQFTTYYASVTKGNGYDHSDGDICQYDDCVNEFNRKYRNSSRGRCFLCHTAYCCKEHLTKHHEYHAVNSESRDFVSCVGREDAFVSITTVVGIIPCTINEKDILGSRSSTVSSAALEKFEELTTENVGTPNTFGGIVSEFLAPIMV